MGANGQNGRMVIDELQKKQLVPIAGVRREETAKEFSDRGIASVVIDLINDRVEDIKAKLPENIEAIIFTAGAAQNRPQDAVWLDLDGAVKLMTAAKAKGIKHFIMESAAGAESRDTWSVFDIPIYYLAKYYAEEALIHSGLNYTVVRPAILTNETGTNHVGLIQGDNRVSRADVAAVMVQAVLDKELLNQRFDLYNGVIPITEVGVQLENIESRSTD
ncbi:hypothetical protein IV55_GL000091 [Furfurilactobacillus siliginis]|nr:hypothetical protein IV55_GL000091 [Furfurilactobacillus siliginis]